MSMFKWLDSGLGYGCLPDPTAYNSRITTAFINRSIEYQRKYMPEHQNHDFICVGSRLLHEKILRDVKENRDAMNAVDENNAAIDGQCVQRDDVKLLEGKHD